jgi:hypothetical protein
MYRNRIIVAILTALVLCAAADNAGPALGKWEFTGKDSAGVAWNGTLNIEKLDPNRFDANKYHSMCSLQVQSATSSHGVEAPCRYDPATRTVSFSTGVSTTHSYTAVLSPDGKSLKGKWTESKGDRPKDMTVVKTGEWSAKLSAQ